MKRDEEKIIDRVALIACGRVSLSRIILKSSLFLKENRKKNPSFKPSLRYSIRLALFAKFVNL